MDFKDPKIMAGIAVAAVVVLVLVLWVARVGPFA